jgi:hypothetical protein
MIGIFIVFCISLAMSPASDTENEAKIGKCQLLAPEVTRKPYSMDFRQQICTNGIPPRQRAKREPMLGGGRGTRQRGGRSLTARFPQDALTGFAH